MKQAAPNSKTSAIWNGPITVNKRRAKRSGLLALSVGLVIAGPLVCLAQPVTISAHGTVGPNRYSPIWTNWWAHAVQAIQSGTTTTGNQFADPSAWVERT